MIGDMVRVGAARAANQFLFTTADGDGLTYGAVNIRANRVANALQGLGLKPGDRVAVWASTSIQYMELYIGAARGGFAITPINERFKIREARHQFEDSGAKILFYSENLVHLVNELNQTSDIPNLVCLDGKSEILSLGFEDLLETGSSRFPIDPDPDGLFILGYTSGTTGFPKGAMLTQRSVKILARMNAHSIRLPLSSVNVWTSSMSFVASIGAIMMSHIHVGGTIVVASPWDIDRVMKTSKKWNATSVHFPTPAIVDLTQAMIRNPDDWLSWVSLFQSASKAPANQMRNLAEISGTRLVSGWGMTENSGGLATAFSLADVAGRTTANDLFESAGRAVADAEVRLIDADGNDLPHDGETIGELCIRTPALMKGYWNNPVASEKALVDGWYHTGDLGYIDLAGYVYISDRRSDLIVSGGMNVYPTEVETIILELPKIFQCAVIGIPDDRWGQAVVAVIKMKEGEEMTDQEVIDHCRSQIAHYKQPTRVIRVETFPVTASEKIKRAELRTLLGF